MKYYKNKKITVLFNFGNILFFLLLIFLLKIDLNYKSYIFALLSFLFYYLFDLYDLNINKFKFKDILKAGILNFIFFFLAYSTKSFDINLAIILYSFNFIYQTFLKYIIINFIVKKKNILYIGNDLEFNLLKEVVNKNAMYNLIKNIDVNLEKLNAINIEEIVDTEEIEKIIYAFNPSINDKILKTFLKLKIKGIKIIQFLDFYEEVEGKIAVKRINENWFLEGGGFNIFHDSFQKKLKRLFDIIFSIIIFVFSFPVMLISMILIKIESRGPIFFIQNRIGEGEKSFKIVKFRSMKVHDETKHSKYASENDSRITKFGKFMRKTRIDELPQLWNVLCGEMSFVGPRAEWDKLCYGYMKEIPFYNMRHSIKPGLTGWAQVNYPYGASVEDALKKLQYDLFYIKHQSFLFDLTIIFKTVKTVIFGKGR